MKWEDPSVLKDPHKIRRNFMGQEVHGAGISWGKREVST